MCHYGAFDTRCDLYNPFQLQMHADILYVYISWKAQEKMTQMANAVTAAQHTSCHDALKDEDVQNFLTHSSSLKMMIKKNLKTNNGVDGHVTAGSAAAADVLSQRCLRRLICIIWSLVWLWLFGEETVRLSKLHVCTHVICWAW